MENNENDLDGKFSDNMLKLSMEKLMNGALKEPRYTCCFTSFAKELEEEKSWLEAERKIVHQHIEIAKSRGEDVEDDTLLWDEEVDKLIQEDTNTKQKCFFGFCPHCILRYRRGKELANKKVQIKKLIETGKELSIRLPACPPDIEGCSSVNYISFKSRESKYKELLDALTDDNNYKIGLQGMGGIGKTTLAQEMGKKLMQSKQFMHVIFTKVSISSDYERYQEDIARSLSLKLVERSIEARAMRLRLRLTNGEKILLILDDVGDLFQFHFELIGIPDSVDQTGCRILITTCSLLVCKTLRCSKTIQLDLLSEEDAWIMFQRHAGLSEISNKSLLDKGRIISNESKRLPFAIAAIASSLMGKQRPEEWDVALKSLQKDVLMHDVDDIPFKIYTSLNLSYDNMEDATAKRLFLLCSVLQEDEKIPFEMVTRLGIGAGFFGENYPTYNAFRKIAFYYRHKLLDCCLLLEDNQNKVKMHDLVRNAARQIANKEIQRVKLDGKNQKEIVEREKNIKYLFCEGKLKDVFSYKLDGSMLQILIVTVYKDEDCHDVKIKVPDSFFENNNGLRVFHLLNDHYQKIALSLPQSIKSLKNIRSILFTLVDLGDISILAILRSLVTLDLKDCKIDELPHGIAELEKFRLLNLECCRIVRNNPFEVIERCSLLEELYFTGSFNDFCREITFPKLQRFCIDEHRRSVNDWSSKHVSVVEKDEVFLSETTLKYCMQTTAVLRLTGIQGGWRNLIPDIVSMDQGMNDIVELSLSCMSQLQHLIDTDGIGVQVPNVFLSKLVVLKLDRMENLEELFNGPVSFESLKNLEEISIKDCKHLKILFKCKVNLTNLKIINLQNCPMLVSVFQPSTSRSLVSLEKLQIANCEGLENIVMCDKREESRGEIDDGDNNKKIRGSMFSMLRVIAIEECPRLEYIFPFLSAQSHPVLEAIIIRRCDKLKYIIGQEHSKLSYRLHIWEYVQCLPIQSYSMCNIKEINLSDFLAIKSLFILSITPRMLLETLTIKNCGELKNIIIDDNRGNKWGDVFPKLQRIYVKDCIKFEYIFGYYDGDYRSHNEIHLHLPALKYISLCNLPGLVAMCTKQYRPTFPPLVQLQHNGYCSNAAIKSFHDFKIHPSLESLDTIKKAYIPLSIYFIILFVKLLNGFNFT